MDSFRACALRFPKMKKKRQERSKKAGGKLDKTKKVFELKQKARGELRRTQSFQGRLPHPPSSPLTVLISLGPLAIKFPFVHDRAAKMQTILHGYTLSEKACCSHVGKTAHRGSKVNEGSSARLA